MDCARCVGIFCSCIDRSGERNIGTFEPRIACWRRVLPPSLILPAPVSRLINATARGAIHRFRLSAFPLTNRGFHPRPELEDFIPHFNLHHRKIGGFMVKGKSTDVTEFE